MSCCYPEECCEMVPAAVAVAPVFGSCCPDPYAPCCPEQVCYACLPPCPRPYCCRPAPQPRHQYCAPPNEEMEIPECCYEREYSSPPHQRRTEPERPSRPPRYSHRSPPPRSPPQRTPPARRSCPSPEPVCCQLTVQPVKTKYVIPCYRYEDGRIVRKLPVTAFKRNGMQDQEHSKLFGTSNFIERCPRDVAIECEEVCPPAVKVCDPVKVSTCDHGKNPLGCCMLKKQPIEVSLDDILD